MGVLDFELLSKRYTCYDDGYGTYGGYNCGNSAWYNWGRWVVVVVIIVAVLLAFFLFSCITSRRRRRRGVQPFYGTGWMAGHPQQQGVNPPSYYNQQEYNQPPPQPYGESAGYYAPQGGYYGQQQGVELQSPQHAYQPPHGSGGYAAPPGPPPNKVG